MLIESLTIFFLVVILYSLFLPVELREGIKNCRDCSLEAKLNELDKKVKFNTKFVKKNYGIKEEVDQNTKDIKKFAEHYKDQAEKKTGLKEGQEYPKVSGT